MNTENVIYTYGTTHELKTWPSFFNAVMNDIKPFEVRKFDRPFKIGDVLLLREYNPNTESYTGAVCTRQIQYILKGGSIRDRGRFLRNGITEILNKRPSVETPMLHHLITLSTYYKHN